MCERIEDPQYVVETATYRDRLGRERYNRRKFVNRHHRAAWNIDDDAKREAVRARIAFENELQIVSLPGCELEDRHAE
jgi:hypothetical protein